MAAWAWHMGGSKKRAVEGSGQGPVERGVRGHTGVPVSPAVGHGIDLGNI